MGRWCCRLRPSNNTGKVKSSITPSKSLYSDSLASQKYEAQKKILFSKQDSVLEVISRLILVWESRIKHCISTRNLISIFLKIK